MKITIETVLLINKVKYYQLRNLYYECFLILLHMSRLNCFVYVGFVCFKIGGVQVFPASFVGGVIDRTLMADEWESGMPDKPNLLLLEPMMPDVEARLADMTQICRLDPAGTVPRNINNTEIVVTGGGTGVPRSVMDALPDLRLIAINGVGTDAVDLKEAARRGISVTTTPGVLTDDVADMAMLLLLSGMRDLVVADRFVRDGKWGSTSLPLSHKATGCSLGIFGMGHVGRAIAHRASAFGMKIAYSDLRDLELNDMVFIPNLISLAKRSDVLVIAATGGVQTHHVVDREVMDALGPHGLLVNVARGSIVDEQALISALAEGRLGKAALDVFEHEPYVPAALREMSQVTLQPHRASATVETRHAMGCLVIDNVAAFLAHAALPTKIV